MLSFADYNGFSVLYAGYLKTKYHLKVLWTFKNIFETFHDFNDSDEKTKMLKTPS